MARNRKVELSTIIGKDCIIRGEVEVKGGLRVDGEVKGSIRSDGFVTVGRSGLVNSNIEAEECLVLGDVNGDINVRSAVELDKTSRMTGNITAKILKIHEGAIFNGCSKMKEGKNEERAQVELDEE